MCHLGEQHDWVSPLPELVALAAITRQAKVRTVFEVGTYTGMATLVMAMNAPTGCEISTLDLDPTQRAQHGVHPFTLGSAFLETPFRHQIRQLYGDSMTFDYGPFLGRMDLVFIDAVHTYDRVRSDTLNAFKLLRPGGYCRLGRLRLDRAASRMCRGVPVRRGAFKLAAVLSRHRELVSPST